MFSEAMFLDTFENLQRNIHEINVAHGFWDEGEFTVEVNCGPVGMEDITYKKNPWNFGEKIGLVHAELSEALECHRDPLPVDFKHNEIQWWSEDGGVSDKWSKDYNHPEGLPIELADAVIRIMDLAHKMGIDLGRAILEKVRYNRDRPYRHGKAY
jgi:hypothetical protein